VEKAIPTEDQVDLRRDFTNDIEHDESPVLLGEAALIGFDHSGNYVSADILIDLEGDVAHPVKVTARRIEHGANSEFGNDLWQLLTKLSRVLETRTWPRARFSI
jgi:hypothetical protein